MFKKAETSQVYGLRISGITDLSFLDDFPSLLYLEIVDQKRRVAQIVCNLGHPAETLRYASEINSASRKRLPSLGMWIANTLKLAGPLDVPMVNLKPTGCPIRSLNMPQDSGQTQ